MYLKRHKIKQFIDVLNLIMTHGGNTFGTDTCPCLQLLICFAFLKKEDFLGEVRDLFCPETQHHYATKKKKKGFLLPGFSMPGPSSVYVNGT